jgi:hypothetical protein
MADNVSPLVWWGGAAIAAVVVIVAVANSNGDEPPKDVCGLGAAGVTLVATGLAHGEDAKAIAGALSGVGAAAACSAAVEGLKQDPQQPVPITVNGTTQSYTLDQLLQSLTAAERQHSSDCLTSYGFGTQNDIACLNYTISPY